MAAYDSNINTDRFLVETMVEDARAEFLIGVKRETGLGLALVVGSGGTEVESLRDYRTLLLPASDAQILNALGKLALAQRLKLEDSTLHCLLSAVRAVVRFAEQHRTSLIELDVNPLILREDGDTVAADALIRLNKC
ncbi:MAG: acetate--CoA ligase family protein [Proteobacteria bacterium]|nr:acetate--CoA ligase family protein [Pseudomonadota bacterium]